MSVNPRKGLIALSTIIVALLLSEAGLRLFHPVEYGAPVPRVAENRWNTGFHRRSDVPGLAYELNPHAEGSVRGTYAIVNSHGMRGPERPIEKAPGSRRIAVIGDSFTFGFGVAQEKLFCRVLERRLNRSDDLEDPYEVLNFGVGGYSCRDNASVLEHVVPEWQPDLVILTYVLNDAELDANQPLHRYFQETHLWQYSHLCRLVAKVLDPRTRAPSGASGYWSALYAPGSPNWRAVQDTFENIRETADRLGLNLAVLVFAEIPTETWSRYAKLRAIHRQVIDELEANGLTVLDLFDTFSEHDPVRLRVSPRDHHPSALAHRLVARFLFEALQTDERLGFR